MIWRRGLFYTSTFPRTENDCSNQRNANYSVVSEFMVIQMMSMPYVSLMNLPIFLFPVQTTLLSKSGTADLHFDQGHIIAGSYTAIPRASRMSRDRDTMGALLYQMAKTRHYGCGI